MKTPKTIMQLAGILCIALFATLARAEQTVHAFGGEPLRLALPDQVQASMVMLQLTSSLVAPHGGRVTINGDSLDVTTIAVRRETDLVLRGYDEAGRAIPQIRLRLYPRHLLAPLRAWSENHAIQVSDELSDVAMGLQSDGVRFTRMDPLAKPRLPGVYFLREQGILKVTAVLADFSTYTLAFSHQGQGNLAAQPFQRNPRLQKRLVQWIQFVHSERSISS